jgi:hypothetical protein
MVAASLVCGASLVTGGTLEAAGEGLVPIFVDGFDVDADCAWGARVGSTYACPATIHSVQSSLITGRVALSSVFVTALTADRRHLWVSDAPEAAVYQGVYVYRGGSVLPLPPEFEIGTGIDVVGDTLEYDPGTPVNSLTEIVATEEPVVAGVAGIPVPLTVGGAAALGDIQQGEPFEGVLVRLEFVTAGPLLVGDRIELTDGSDGSVLMDDFAWNYGSIAEGTCFASVTGVMDLQSAFDERHILPRGAFDLVVGAGCL